ncbi:type V CRISPR-associated endonuclease Cas1 [Pseudobutyrivibrio xylanivorans]|uniref:Type V CRISPR-associated endonuclease Cas1 n=1 Tax=Pseudobutyrivibrio xylanivorans TaxID=185007 RepID=A0A5P6VNZ0_PSEXY|nr:type V CRISPR-associated endonuclease Cas1 [Pseudobutyrivibrio xylanivorans]QFJ54393.1 type V CRISPR-associated endonuclease Cas1 [Pseudobutyrivibrio xylanivorans]
MSDSDGKVKYQHTCYRIFCVIVIGDCTITTGLLRRAKKYAFSICFMTYSLRMYSVIKAGLEGNNLLHKKQYEYNGLGLARLIIYNKILNQRNTLNQIRKKTDYLKEGIALLDEYLERLSATDDWNRNTLLGIEGNAAKVYFPRVFENTKWKSRKPRIKFDYINSLLDIGYTILFNFIDCILNVYDFDVYQGVLHTNFYMRKSLVCDLMEPFRPIIDWRVRKGINLGQFKEEDFLVVSNQWQLEYKKSNVYSMIFLEDLLENKECIFLYLRSYYRAFMKGKDASEFPIFDINSNDVVLMEG